MSSEDPDSVVATVNELQDLCDAVDIDQCNSSCDDKNDAWNAWITCIEKVQRDCKIPIFCKLPFSRQTVDETVRKGKLLQEAGCKVKAVVGKGVSSTLMIATAFKPEQGNYDLFSDCVTFILIDSFTLIVMYAKGQSTPILPFHSFYPLHNL